MKKLILFYLIVLGSTKMWAQSKYINDNFNTVCISSSSGIYPWVAYNPLPATIPDGMWKCAPTEGRGGSNGISCSGYYSSAFHIDTSYLISPLLNFSTITNPVRLRFDSKTTRITQGGKLSVYTSSDSVVGGGARLTDITTSLLPVISSADSSDWVTHTIDMSNYKDSTSFYIAFMYTSPATSGSIWYLDNIRTDTSDITNVAGSPAMNAKNMFTVNANYADNNVIINYNKANSGRYKLSLTDLSGREMYTAIVSANDDAGTLTINNLNLNSGMYLLKMNNETSGAVAKIIVY